MKIILDESQYKRLFENSELEGFRFSGMHGANNLTPSTIEFDPNVKYYSDTSIFKQGTNDFNARIQILPRSGLKSINLYFIRNMNINKAIKHGVNLSGEKINVGNENAANSIEYFKKRSAYYITRILSKMGVYPDLFTSPQSSSEFNKEMLSLISRYYPKGSIIEMPNSMKKDVRNITINVQAAKELGLSNEEIAHYQNILSKYSKDEDIRGFRLKIEQLKQEIASLMTHKRGRPSRDITDRRKQINAYNELIKANRRPGRDSTIDKNGKIKSFQIKSLDDKQRRILDGLFVFNDNEYPSIKYSKNGIDYEYPQYLKFYGKIIVVFDDNISSGATLDMMCNELKKYNPKMIIPITLGQIPLTSYSMSERMNAEKRA